jgi:hypothetical protein
MTGRLSTQGQRPVSAPSLGAAVCSGPTADVASRGNLTGAGPMYSPRNLRCAGKKGDRRSAD